MDIAHAWNGTFGFLRLSILFHNKSILQMRFRILYVCIYKPNIFLLLSLHIFRLLDLKKMLSMSHN